MMKFIKDRMFLLTGILMAAAFCFYCTGCQGPSAAQPKTSTQPKTSAQPKTSPEKVVGVKNMVRLDVSFNNQITLLGYTITPEKVLKPGQTCTLTWYWKVEKPLAGEWKRFVHITSDGDEIIQNIQNIGNVPESNPPHKWKAGKTVVDKQVFTLTKDADEPKITIVVGLYDEDGRLAILKGNSNGRDAATGPTLETGVK